MEETLTESKKVTTVPVKLINIRGESSLVEWTVNTEGVITYHRAYVPSTKVKQSQVEQRILDRGIPYGLQWEELVEIIATPERIANELRAAGIWTWDDLTRHMAVLQGINQAFDRGRFLSRAEQEGRK